MRFKVRIGPPGNGNLFLGTLTHKTRFLRIFLIFDLTMQKVGGMMTDVKGLGLALSVNVVGY